MSQPTSSDLEARAARIADPGIDLKTKLAVACELRDMVETVKDADTPKSIPTVAIAVVDILKNTEPSNQKDSTEFAFRRVLIEILHRIPTTDAVRSQAPALCGGLLHVVGADFEENAITCCKILLDVVRNFKPLNEELVSQFFAIAHTVFLNIPQIVEETLSEDSSVLEANTLVPSVRSFKVFAELAILVVILLQNQKQLVLPIVMENLNMHLDTIRIQSPAQRKAREEYEAMGNYWAGIAPTIRNYQAYTDFIIAQVKMASFLMFFLRTNTTPTPAPEQPRQWEPELEILILSTLRLLQDCPATAIAPRKDLMIIFRYLITTSTRRVLLSHIDKLLEERVLLGTSLSSQETVRSTALGCIADLLHHLRGDLSPPQLTKACLAFLRHLHNPYLSNQIHMVSARMVFNLVEPIMNKESSAEASKTLAILLEGCVDKFESMALVLEEVFAKMEKSNSKPESKDDGTESKSEKTEALVVADITLLEKARPIASATYAVEKPEELLLEYRSMLRHMQHATKAILAALKKCDAPLPDSALVGRLFEAYLKCVPLFDGDNREAIENMEWLCGILLEINLHVFQEVWTSKMAFLNNVVQKRPVIMHIASTLLQREAHSPTVVAIILRFCVSRLDQLGEQDEQQAAITIKWFKTVFLAVTMHAKANEPILASHLGKLIMDSFPLAAKASKPTHYFHLLRALFRAIGGGGGRFELLYQEVLPLLPEMLECLSRQLQASDGFSRDMIVELCLTVPLRLTHLLPYLSYLMQPLALALRGNPELASQGLRTLELCIDNLTPDFLDPTLNVVLRDLMEALFSHLRPLPANHHHSHTTIRILGKLGGRNRRLLQKDPVFRYHSHPESSVVRMSFTGMHASMKVSPALFVAGWVIRAGKSLQPYRQHSFSYIESVSNLLLNEGVRGKDREDLFTRCLEAMFDAIQVAETQESAETYIQNVSHYIFNTELRRASAREITASSSSRRHPGVMFTSLLDAFTYGLARDSLEGERKVERLVQSLIKDLIAMADSPDVPLMDIRPIFNQIASKITSLCLEDTRIAKSAGCSAIRFMANLPGLGIRWTTDRIADVVRTLLFVLKDMAFELPDQVKEVNETIELVLNISYTEMSTNEEQTTSSKTLMLGLTGIFFAELSGQNAIVRGAAHHCIELLSRLTNIPTPELLMPHRERILTAIYTKPLRALPFPAQVGIVEAIRYCLSLDPPLPELNDELLRLLHEALALADAEDGQLMSRVPQRQSNTEIVKLRVACIKLLTASMPVTDFFARQQNTRQRVTSIYFKSLYSPVAEIKDVAHEGLRMVLLHQARLPKELLQTGLRPILMNLADAKRLTPSGLEALARLLELLTNYFKVEIGHKLLDHYRAIADPQMLQASSRLPLSENEGVQKLVRLTNIFHLLPSAANMFLENLVNLVVQTEVQMHFSGRSPFSEPLAKYLDRYYIEAVDFFMRHLQFPSHVRTLRSILQANLAPRVLRELLARTPSIVSGCLESGEPTLTTAGLLLCQDIVKLVPDWLTEHDYVTQTLLNLWRREPPPFDNPVTPQSETHQRYSILLTIFRTVLETTPRVDLVFELVAIFMYSLPFDQIGISQFLYRHVSLNPSLMYRRNVLTRFCTWFSDPAYSYGQKTFAFRFIITPTILANATSSLKDGLLDSDMIQWFHNRLWIPMTESRPFPEADDLFRIELLHFTTIMVQHYPHLLVEAKKDIIKCAWSHIPSEDGVVKHTAYLLAARFFDAWEGPQKFILTVWTGLLSRPHAEGKSLVRQALDILAPVLQRSERSELGYPQWAKTTRKLLAEESGGWSQIGLIYQLMARQSDLFYPVRALFIPHVVNNMPKLGLSPSASIESRLLIIEVLQIIFDWEQRSASGIDDTDVEPEPESTWTTPLHYRESIVSFLVRIATTSLDTQSRNHVVPKALNLLRAIAGPSGWPDVTLKLHFFIRALQQNDLTIETNVTPAASSARVLQTFSSEKPDAWINENLDLLTKLVRRGMIVEDVVLQDNLHAVIDRILRIHPLPKEDEETQGELSDFFSWIHSTINDSLRVGTSVRGALLLLKSAVLIAPERIQPYASSLGKLLATKAKDHVLQGPTTAHDSGVRLIILMIEISKQSISFLGESRRSFITCLSSLATKSKNMALCRFILDLGREWALNPRESAPTMKEKISLLQCMATFENRERGEPLMQSYLDLLLEIYTEPSLRRSELTTRLEQQFLLGCRAADTTTREKFIDLLDASIPRTLYNRLAYIFGVQNWEALADRNWIFIALHLVLGCVDGESPLVPDRKSTLETGPLPSFFALGRVSSLARPLQRIMFLDPSRAHETWASIFPALWACLSRKEQVELTHLVISLLSKEYHIQQAEVRPNIIYSILCGISDCSPPIMLPPHLVKYLAKTFGAWHVCMKILESSLDYVRDDEAIVRDTVYDALAEVYAELAEDDLFYGLWRRRCLYPDTNIALAFEQSGLWEHAATMYEIAQGKSRNGMIPFSEPEYCLWEDHWILAAEKLQQWETLQELSRSENNIELQLECAWRIKDWHEQKDTIDEMIKELPEVATPRRLVFEAFLSLLKDPGAVEKNAIFTMKLENAMQLSLRKWISMPYNLCSAHIPLLQHFQQFVELQEAVQIFGSLSTTTAQTLEKKSSDLKMVLQAWRERLPNICDDVSIWSDLVAWRQNVFNSINKTYIPLINSTPQAGTQAGTTNTYGYRGYHETAWIINRFAHVARKHGLLDVCVSSLNKIYTLPNIEISEAFLKLREQARCHYQKPGEINLGLEVINNTNLKFFPNSQKAEFYTLKGMFYEKLENHAEAEAAYGQGVQLDLNQAKAWAAWGKYNDRLFKEQPTNMTAAAQAVNCYLQAAGLFKNRKSRPLLTRVLWLVSIEDPSMMISRAFDTYKGDAAWWYWITLIPQLCLSLSHREVKQARYVLLNIAKLYPQALFFHLRTTKEEISQLRKHQAFQAQLNQAQTAAASASQTPVRSQNSQDVSMEAPGEPARFPSGGEDPAAQAHALRAITNGIASPADPNRPKQPPDLIDEVGQILKTAFPLLIMSLETIVDQISQRFRSNHHEEEIFRLISMLLQDALAQYGQHMVLPEDPLFMSPDTQATLGRLAQNFGSTSLRTEYEEDFIKSKPKLPEYCARLQRWRDKYEKYLDSRPRVQTLDTVSHYLIDYPHSKYDDIEIPGQYTEEKDNNQSFVKLQKFGPKYENCRTQGYCFKRFTMIGHDNSKTSFAVQIPSARHCRREERAMHVLRSFNGILSRKKESHKRNLHFHVPVVVPCHPNMRLLQNDSSYVTFGDMYDQFCQETGLVREDPILIIGERMRATMIAFKQARGKWPTKTQHIAMKKELLDEIRLKVVPEDIITRYMLRTMDGPTELWRMRKEFTLQIASTSFCTYALALSSRLPSRYQVSRATGQIAMSEVLPGVPFKQDNPLIISPDVVPFRLTPNLQHFIGPIHTEGLLVTSLMAIARCLTESEGELDQQLCLFARDEVMTWLHGGRKPWTHDLNFRAHVATFIADLVKKVDMMACKREREEAMNLQNLQGGNVVPIYKSATTLVSSATNPINLASMADTYMAWF